MKARDLSELREVLDEFGVKCACIVFQGGEIYEHDCHARCDAHAMKRYRDEGK